MKWDIRKKVRLVELQGEFNKLRPPMFDRESEDAAKSYLLNIKQCF